MIDDDITISPSPQTSDGTVPASSVGRDKTSTVEASANAFKTSAAGAAVAAGAALAGAMSAGKSALETKIANLAEKVEAKEPPKFDLDFHLDDKDKPTPLRPRETPTLTSASEVTPTPSQLARPAAALELDKLDLSFDPERTTFEDPTPSVLDGQWHDAATKLDLAKAYQEMGDVEGAREILQEVLHEGDDQQKTEAQALLAKLG
jgi:FimV-like protein